MRRINVVIVLSLLLGGCTLPFLPQPKSALQVSSQPTASIFLDNERIGQTTQVVDTLKPGAYSLKLSVDNDPTKEWQTTINLNPQLVTVVSRNFGALPELSSYYILELEPLESKNAIELKVETIPDNVIVKLNGQPEGFSPVSVTDISEGDQSIILSAPGYQDLSLSAKTKKGYRLIISAGLARLEESLTGDLSELDATASAQLNSIENSTSSSGLVPPSSPLNTLSPTAAPLSTATASAALMRPYVTILNTPTGWLRVRSTPDSNAENEVARINPGEQYKFIEVNDSGWFKIEYEPARQGWISARYADLTR